MKYKSLTQKPISKLQNKELFIRHNNHNSLFLIRESDGSKFSYEYDLLSQQWKFSGIVQDFKEQVEPVRLQAKDHSQLLSSFNDFLEVELIPEKKRLLAKIINCLNILKIPYVLKTDEHLSVVSLEYIEPIFSRQKEILGPGDLFWTINSKVESLEAYIEELQAHERRIEQYKKVFESMSPEQKEFVIKLHSKEAAYVEAFRRC